MSERIPTGWLNYRGDVRAAFTEHQAFGPDYNGETHFAVETSYDEAANMTRVGFTKVAPEVSA